MFTKILIANRGEIACRVITTAQAMGLGTVAVYSDADANAKHVAMADEAVHIGPADATESYLAGEKIIQAARDTGADAIHPGYGFLSENPEFVQAIEDAGLTFIGPPASAIRAMGLKDAAKALMERAGVPVVPGYHGQEQDPDALAQKADAIGYPVLIKARAGGGGKGMRLVEDPTDFKSALASAAREAQASFGDPVCLIEKYITQPRHIEIQVFGDSHGNVIHLFERDCSLQRRHQKVIEEAPAPDMPDAVRAAMGKAAVEAAKAIGYEGAGTVEFIADGSGPLREDGFWFMEMNTRLQVEHPVTEAITGLDLVDLQLRVAAGEALPVAQNDIAINGWAFEARVYAENVAKGFLPATGMITHLAFPNGTTFRHGPVRIDAGVREGDQISPWYDPMIAKLIVHGPTRAAALNRLSSALADCHVAGTETNLEFLGALSRHDGFEAGNVDTGLIARDLETLIDQSPADAQTQALAAIAALGLLPNDQPGAWDALKGWRSWGSATHEITLAQDDTDITARVTLLEANRFRVDLPDATTELAIKPSNGLYQIDANGAQRKVKVVNSPNCITIFDNSRKFDFPIPDPLAQTEDTQAGGDALHAPMPGLVKLVFAEPGTPVKAGDALIVLEAMKMEHTLTAPRDGTLGTLHVVAGDQVADGALLLSLEPTDDG